MNRGKKIKKRVSLMLLVIMMLGTMITEVVTPVLTVYADDKEETKDKDKDSEESNGIGETNLNVLSQYGGHNKEIREFLNSYTQADIRMQYNLTYNMLMDGIKSGTNYVGTVNGSALNNTGYGFTEQLQGGNTVASGIMGDISAGKVTSDEEVSKGVEAKLDTKVLREMAEELAKGMLLTDSMKTGKDRDEVLKDITGTFFNNNDGSTIGYVGNEYYRMQSVVSANTLSKLNAKPLKDVTDTIYDGLIAYISDDIYSATAKKGEDAVIKEFKNKLMDVESVAGGVWKKAVAPGKNADEAIQGVGITGILGNKYNYSSETVDKSGWNSAWSKGEMWVATPKDKGGKGESGAQDALGLFVGNYSFGKKIDDTEYANTASPYEKYKSEKMKNLNATNYKKVANKLLNNDKDLKELYKYFKEKKEGAEGNIDESLSNSQSANDKSKLNYRDYKGIAYTDMVSSAEGFNGESSNYGMWFYKKGKNSMGLIFQDADYYIGNNGAGKEGLAGGESVSNFIGMYPNKSLFGSWNPTTAFGLFDTSADIDPRYKGSSDSLTDEASNLSNSNNTVVSSVVSFRGNKDYNYKETSNRIGIDNYGNIISTGDGRILVPYWKNSTVKEFSEFKKFITDPAYSGMKRGTVEEINSLGKTAKANASREAEILKGDFSNVRKAKLFGDKTDDAINEAKKKLESTFSSGADGDKAIASLLGGSSSATDGLESNTNDEKKVYARALALVITEGTYTQVQKYNKRFYKSATDSNIMYIENGNGDAGDADKGLSDLDRFTAADILQKIGIILEVGAGELLRLTIASRVIAVYNSDVLSYGLNSIFYTRTINESSNIMEGILGLAKILGMVLGFLVLYWVYRVAVRRDMKLKQAVMGFIVGSMCLLIPLNYGKTVDLLLNKPASWTVGKQLNQISILDFWVMNKQDMFNELDNSRLLKQFYGMADSEEKINEIMKNRKLDYTIYFPTTIHKSGFDVTSEGVEENLNVFQRMRYNQIADKTTGMNWSKNELERVGVSSFDLKAWAEEMKDKEGSEVVPLFTWLVANDKDGLYDDLSGENGQVKEMPVDLNKYFTDSQKSLTGKKDTTSGFKGTGSELFLMLYKEMMKNADFGALAKIDEAMNKETVSNNGKRATITKEARQGLINDLSRTNKTRRILYNQSDASKNGTDANNPFDKSSKLLADSVGMTLPKSDFLGMENIVSQVVPYHEDLSGETTDSDIYKLNKEFLNSYEDNYSIVRRSVSPDATFDEAEKFAMTLEAFYLINKTYGLNLFPKGYEPKTIAFDSYVRLAYIPMGEFSPTNPYMYSVAGYLAKKEQSLSLIAFLIALLGLILFGYVYLVVFYAGMLLISLAVFIYNYLIKLDYSNKSWVGATVIIATFAIVKEVFMLMLKYMNTILNYSYTQYGGFTYPYVLIYSILIIFFVWTAILVVFKKLFKSVFKDFGSLGANSFKESYNKAKGLTMRKLAEKGLYKARNGVRSSTRAMKSAGNMAGKQIKNVKNGEGVSGKLTQGAIRKINAGGRKIAIKTGAYDKLDNFNINRLKEKMKGKSKQVISGVPVVGDGLAKVLPKSQVALFNAKNKSAKIPKNSLGQDQDIYDKMYENAEEGGLVGKDLVQDKVGDFYFQTVAEAELFKKYLDKEGYKNVQNGNHVAVNTKGLDLTKLPAKRKLLAGVEEFLVEESEKQKTKLFMRRKNVDPSKNKLLPYTETPDGIELLVSDSKGFSRKGFNDLVNSSRFKEYFELPNGLDSYIGLDGYIRDNSRIVLKPKKPLQDNKIAVKQLLRRDDELRKTYEVSERSEQNYLGQNDKKLVVSNEGSNARVAELMKDLGVDLDSNMIVQDGAIYYNSNNSRNHEIIKKVRNAVKKEASAQKETLQRFGSVVTSAKSSDSLNAGINMGVSKVGETKDPERLEKFAKLGIKPTDVKKTSVLKSNDALKNKRVEEFGNAIKELKSGNVSRDDLLQYVKLKERNYGFATNQLVYGDSLITKGKEANYYDAVKRLKESAESTGCLSREDNLSITNRIKELERKKHTMESGLFKKKMKEVYMNLDETVRHSKNSDSAYLKILGDTTIPSNQNVYNDVEAFKKQRSGLMEGKGVTLDILSRLDNMSSLDELYKIQDNFDDIKVEDGTVQVSTRGEGKDALKAIKEML